jgi:hypothetical protein
MSSHCVAREGAKDAKRNEVCCFLVSVAGTEWAEYVNERTAGRAKVRYWRRVIDAWPDVPFTKMRARRVGAPHTSEQFKRNARYRGLPELTCGDCVRVGDAHGVIVDHDASANFVVLFDEDSPKYAGSTLSVHPSELRPSPASPLRAEFPEVRS